MSTTDAYVRIICDTCKEEEEAELPYVYMNQYGSCGHYNHLNPRLPDGWKTIGKDQHMCADCCEAYEESRDAEAGDGAS